MLWLIRAATVGGKKEVSGDVIVSRYMVSSWSVLRSYKSMVVECSIAVWICVACVCRDMRALEIVELDATSAILKFKNNFQSEKLAVNLI